MPTHRRYKTVELDLDDDYDDEEEYYEGENGDTHQNGTDLNTQESGGAEQLSPEDEEQMQAGVVAVRAELGDDSDALTEQQIRDALWYYYYDLQSTVDWLRRPKQTPKKEKQKEPSRFDQAATAAAGKKTNNKGWKRPEAQDMASCEKRQKPAFTTAEFFSDTPFLAVPPSRLGILVPANITSISGLLPKLGLLGGSSSGGGKPSKLAALAASRKKAAEEKKKASSASNTEAKELSSSSAKTEQAHVEAQPSSVALLERLGRKDMKTSSVGQQSTRTSGTAYQDSSLRNPAPRRAYPKRDQSSQNQTYLEEDVAPKEEEHSAEPEKSTTEQAKLDEPAYDLQANPSSFAKALFTSGTIAIKDPGNSKEEDFALENGQRLFTLPYPAPIEEVRDTKGKEKSTNKDPFTGPSPDDVVTQAQSRSSKQTPKNPSKISGSGSSAEQKPAALADGVAAVKLDERQVTEPKVKSKNLDVLEEFEKSDIKNSANFVVIGHVDHGKSTLMGRLLYDLSLIPARAFHKLQTSSQQAGKASFSFAWLLDTTESERSRGITVDVASTTFTTPSTDFTILDAPGHQDFVPNMIAGTSQADFAVLVVDAGTDAFEKGMEGGGQTKEHALLARALGVNRLIIAVNKMDSCNPPWAKDRFDTISQQMTPFLMSAGFSNKNVAFVPCAGLTGANVVNPLSSANGEESSPGEKASWYSGPTLLQQLETTASSAPHSRMSAIRSPLRLIISDVFKGSITAPISVTGRIDTGSLQVGDVVLAQPDGETASIKSIELSTSASASSSTEAGSSKPIEWAVAGQIATLHLTDIDPVHLRPGDVICSTSSPVPNIKSFVAKILAFDTLVPGPLDVLKGRLFTEGRVTQLKALLDKKGSSDGSVIKKKPRVVKAGALARIEVALDKALPLEGGNRIVLRSGGASVAAGIVEDLKEHEPQV